MTRGDSTGHEPARVQFASDHGPVDTGANTLGTTSPDASLAGSTSGPAASMSRVRDGGT